SPREFCVAQYTRNRLARARPADADHLQPRLRLARTAKNDGIRASSMKSAYLTLRERAGIRQHGLARDTNSGTNPAISMRRSKHQLHSQLELPGCSAGRQGQDPAEVGTAQFPARYPEIGMIEGVEGFGPKLEMCRLVQRKLPEHR